MELPIESYHDVTIIIDNEEYNLFNSVFGYELTCNRVSGWGLWLKPGTPEEKQIGGEFSGCHFQIKFSDKVVFDNRPSFDK